MTLSVKDALSLAVKCARDMSKSKAKRISGLQILAKELDVSVDAIQGVRAGKRPIPARWCPIVEKVTKHQVLCEDLRPDIDWKVISTRGRRK